MSVLDPINVRTIDVSPPSEMGRLMVEVEETEFVIENLRGSHELTDIRELRRLSVEVGPFRRRLEHLQQQHNNHKKWASFLFTVGPSHIHQEPFRSRFERLITEECPDSAEGFLDRLEELCVGQNVHSSSLKSWLDQLPLEWVALSAFALDFQVHSYIIRRVFTSTKPFTDYSESELEIFAASLRGLGELESEEIFVTLCLLLSNPGLEVVSRYQVPLMPSQAVFNLLSCRNVFLLTSRLQQNSGLQSSNFGGWLLDVLGHLPFEHFLEQYEICSDQTVASKAFQMYKLNFPEQVENNDAVRIIELKSQLLLVQNSSDFNNLLKSLYELDGSFSRYETEIVSKFRQLGYKDTILMHERWSYRLNELFTETEHRTLSSLLEKYFSGYPVFQQIVEYKTSVNSSSERPALQSAKEIPHDFINQIQCLYCGEETFTGYSGGNPYTGNGNTYRGTCEICESPSCGYCSSTFLCSSDIEHKCCYLCLSHESVEKNRSDGYQWKAWRRKPGFNERTGLRRG